MIAFFIVGIVFWLFVVERILSTRGTPKKTKILDVRKVRANRK